MWSLRGTLGAGGSVRIAGRRGLGREAQAVRPRCSSACQTLGFPELLGAVPEPLKSGSRGQEGGVRRTSLGPVVKETLQPPLNHPADTTGHTFCVHMSVRPVGRFTPAPQTERQGLCICVFWLGCRQDVGGRGAGCSVRRLLPGGPSAWKAELGSGSFCCMSLWSRHLLTSDLRAEEQW